MSSKQIYLDWNASGILLPPVQQAMISAIQQTHGNPSSIHQDGQKARAVVEKARRAVAKTVNGHAQGTIFYGSATEANNTLLQSLVLRGNRRLITTALEHPSVRHTARVLRKLGAQVDFVRVDTTGQIDRQHLQELLKDEAPTLLSLMLANNEIGRLYPLKEILAEATHSHPDLLTHVDGTQALGRVKIDFQDLDADFMSVAFHKTGGPKGVAVLLHKEGRTVEAIMFGGMQERGRRPGTENSVAIAGITPLCQEIDANLEEWENNFKRLRTVMLDELTKGLGDKITVVTPLTDGDSIPNTLNVRLHGIENEDILRGVDLDQLSISAGSACSAGSIEPSPVLIGLGLSRKDAKESIRISLGPLTTEEDVVEGAKRIIKSYNALQSLNL